MGNVAVYRAAWIRAADYERKWDDYHAKVAKGEKADPPTRDLQLDGARGACCAGRSCGETTATAPTRWPT